MTSSKRWLLPLAGGAALVYFLSAVPEERQASKPIASAAPALVLPDLQALADSRDDCLSVVGIAIGSGGAEEVGAFVREHALRYPMLIGNDQIAADYEIRTIPRSVLLDSAGNKAAHWDGPIDREAVRSAVHALGPAPFRC